MFGGSKRKIDDLIDNRWPVPSVWTLVQIIKRKLHKVPINAVWWNRMKHCQVEGRRRKKSLQGTWSEKTALKDILKMHLWWAFCALNDSQLAFYNLCRKWPICLYTVFNTTISTLYLNLKELMNIFTRLSQRFVVRSWFLSSCVVTCIWAGLERCEIFQINCGTFNY